MTSAFAHYLEIVKRGKEVDKVEALLKVAACLYMIGF